MGNTLNLEEKKTKKRKKKKTKKKKKNNDKEADEEKKNLEKYSALHVQYSSLQGLSGAWQLRTHSSKFALTLRSYKSCVSVVKAFVGKVRLGNADLKFIELKRLPIKTRIVGTLSIEIRIE